MRHRNTTALACGLLVISLLGGCESKANLPPFATYGPNPVLVNPHSGLIPTVKIAKVAIWAPGEMPTPAAGLQVSPFETGLAHPRWIYVLPNGDVLVAQSDSPGWEKPTGIRGFFQKLLMKSAGAATASPNQITLLRDTNGDGRADVREVLVKGLTSPFGMAFVGGRLYVANTDSIVSWPYQLGQTHLEGPGEKLVDLPGLPYDHHWTKNIIAGPDGAKLYVTVGSNSNVGERGMQAETNRAAILEVDLATRRTRAFASGIRNPNGMDYEPVTGALWTAVNERDELGDDLVPDYMTSVKDGAFYGWPYSYYGAHEDSRPKPKNPALVARAIAPDYALGAHTASLGLVFNRSTLLPAKYAGGAFIGQHGSWNRSEPAGYKVIFVPFAGGKPSGMPQDILTGFLDREGRARGRPVGVAIDKAGGLLVADDVGGMIWRVSPAGSPMRP